MTTLTYRGVSRLNKKSAPVDMNKIDKIYRGVHYFALRKDPKVAHDMVYRGVHNVA